MGLLWIKDKVGGGSGNPDPNKWNKGSFNSSQKSLEHHFEKHLKYITLLHIYI